MENLEKFKRLAKKKTILKSYYLEMIIPIVIGFFIKKMALVDILYLFHLQKCTK